MRASKLWKAAAVICTLINVGGALYAAVRGEWMHAAVHDGILGAGLFAWQVVRFRDNVEPAAQTQTGDTRLDSLQESIDSIALNVERIGEDQRFQEKLLKERAAKTPPKP